MGINVNDLNQSPLGGELLSGSESIMGNLRVLSEEELSLSGGGGHGKGKGKGKGKGGYGYPCPPPCGSRCY
jgi:hypothetical protein